MEEFDAGLEMEAAIEAGWKGGRRRRPAGMGEWQAGRRKVGRRGIGSSALAATAMEAAAKENVDLSPGCVRFLFARFLQKPPRGVILLRACARRWPIRRADTVQGLAKA